MTDTNPTYPDSVTYEPQPPKKGGTKLKGLGLIVLLLIFGVALVFFYFCPWLLSNRTTVEVTGRNEVFQSQVESLNRRVATLESRVESLASANALQAAPPPPPPAAEEAKVDASATAAALAHAQGDLVALSSAMTALQSEVKATGATAAETRETSATLIASVVAFIQLREATATGGRFVNELTLLRDASRNDPILQSAVARLEPFAASGAPTLNALHDELLEREPAVAVAVAKGSAKNWWQRVVAQLQGLITVRQVHGGAGDTLAQLAIALTKDGAAASLEAFKELPPAAQRNLADWQARLEARQHIDEGIAAITAHFTTLPTVKTP
jgi:hypothetical protein